MGFHQRLCLRNRFLVHTYQNSMSSASWERTSTRTQGYTQMVTVQSDLDETLRRSWTAMVSQIQLYEVGMLIDNIPLPVHIVCTGRRVTSPACA